jgi:hypothetical protein
MAAMGKYCKAYSLKKLREFKGWAEKTENARKEKQAVNGKEVEATRVLAEGDYLYLQENYVVTDGIFKDENVVFDSVTPEWIEYCQQTLKFEIPVYEPDKPTAATGQAA